jgi:hypothetical protein
MCPQCSDWTSAQCSYTIKPCSKQHCQSPSTQQCRRCRRHLASVKTAQTTLTPSVITQLTVNNRLESVALCENISPPNSRQLSSCVCMADVEYSLMNNHNSVNVLSDAKLRRSVCKYCATVTLQMVHQSENIHA